MHYPQSFTKDMACMEKVVILPAALSEMASAHSLVMGPEKIFF
jgi:hypothetical protein